MIHQLNQIVRQIRFITAQKGNLRRNDGMSKDNPSYTNKLWFLFKIVICFMIAVAIVGIYIMQKETDESFWTGDSYNEAVADSIIYAGDFYRVFEDGTREKINVPGRCTVSRGETLVIESEIPADFDSNIIAMRATHQNVKMYVNNELRLNYDTNNSRLIGIYSPNRFVMCPTSSGDAGKTLTVEILTGARNYTGKVSAIYACDRYELLTFLLHSYGPKILVAFIVVLIGFLTVGIGFVLQLGFKHRFGIEYLGWLIVATGGWQLTTSEIK